MVSKLQFLTISLDQQMLIESMRLFCAGY